MSDTEIELVALINFERLNAEQYPENERWGEAYIKITVDKEPETQEDFDEIAKALFKPNQYNQLALKQVFYDDNGFFDALNQPTPKNAEAFVINQSGDMGLFDMKSETIKGEVVDE